MQEASFSPISYDNKQKSEIDKSCQYTDFFYLAKAKQHPAAEEREIKYKIVTLASEVRAAGEKQRTNQISKTKIVDKHCKCPINSTHLEKLQSDSAIERKLSQSVVDPNIKPFWNLRKTEDREYQGFKDDLEHEIREGLRVA